ncbi:MAG: MBL fold metallo-hydrolase [Clostridia bacterium]|nr:MBL fold metallo-hydrolase [Clostridia bacterium]
MARRKKKLSAKALFLAILFLVIVLGGYYVYNNYINKKEPVEVKGEISFHFMMLGNDNAGDCTYIKAGDNDILIDAGSRENSIDDIKDYIDDYVTDNTLEFVIVTHGDQDHIAGFSKNDGSIFDLYECETIIDFPKTNKETATYNRYLSERADEVDAGANHYTALECYNEENGAKRVYDLSGDGSIKMEIMYNYFYEHKTSDENDYSVCVQFSHGDRKFLFTGDLEKDGEEYFVKNNDLDEVVLFKAGHHGSKTSSNDCLLNEIKPDICVACCCAGSVEYTQNLSNTFPTQAFIDRIAKHTTKVYVPIMIDLVVDDKGTEDLSDDEFENAKNYEIMNGNIVVISDAEDGVKVECSNNNTVLKDTDWFKENRTTPSNWLS